MPGNHEFDFGKAIFLQRMAEAKFPLFAANLRDADGQPLPGFKDRAIVTFDGVRIGLTGASLRRRRRARRAPEDLKFAADGRHHARHRPRRCAARAPISSSRSCMPTAGRTMS